MSDPRDQLLDAAERLFFARGFDAVTLRDLAAEAGLHHSSLYHHAPGGKAELFAEAILRSTERHAAALRAALGDPGTALRERLRRAARWILANPAGNHTRLLATDLDHLRPEVGERIAQGAWNGLIVPIADALRDEAAAGRLHIDPARIETIAGGLLASLQALQAAFARYGDGAIEDHADYLIDVLLDGLRPRDRAEP